MDAGDTTAKVEESIVPYETIKSIYESQGMSEKEINAILRLSVFEDDDMEALGIHVYHQATRYAYYTQGSELVKWMLTQSKNNKKPGGGADDNPDEPDRSKCRRLCRAPVLECAESKIGCKRSGQLGKAF